MVPAGPEEVRNTHGQDVVKEGQKIIEQMSKKRSESIKNKPGKSSFHTNLLSGLFI